MAIAKVILNGVTQMDVTQDTVTAADLKSGITATAADGQQITGSLATPDIVQMAVDGQNYNGHVVSSYSFVGRSNLFRYVKWTDVCLKGMTTNPDYANDTSNLFYGVTTLRTAAFPAAYNLGQESFRGCSNLTAVDFGPSFKTIGLNIFYSCNVLTTIVLRRTSIVTIGSTNVFTYSNVWKSGGTGGTIYIPKVLYDHLGDGTSSDYKAATNWSTVNGYGTITWAQIEGSIYESQYVDGTLIT